MISIFDITIAISSRSKVLKSTLTKIFLTVKFAGGIIYLIFGLRNNEHYSVILKILIYHFVMENLLHKRKTSVPKQSSFNNFFLKIKEQLVASGVDGYCKCIKFN